MRICLLGDCSGELDEGMKNTTFNLYNGLLNLNQEVMLLRPKSVFFPERLKDFLQLKPDILHYTMGPTWRSFAILSFLSKFVQNCSIVMSSPRPQVTAFQLRTLVRFRPDLLLTQSQRQGDWFREHKFRTKFFPPGVDLDRFVPCSHERKITLRKKYGLESNVPIVLHVGQVSPERELEKLIPLQRKGTYQVVIVAASTIRPAPSIVHSLELAGCKVRQDHVFSIEEYYQLSDLFVFPGAGFQAAIEIPLTVLEAMACNLPVVTAPFGGLPDVFQEGRGFAFASTSEEIETKLDQYSRHAVNEIQTREMVKPYSWKGLAKELLEIYGQLNRDDSVSESKPHDHS